MSVVGYRLPVLRHRGVQLSNLEAQLLLGEVWLRLTVVMSEDWLFLFLALLTALDLALGLQVSGAGLVIDGQYLGVEAEYWFYLQCSDDL